VSPATSADAGGVKLNQRQMAKTIANSFRMEIVSFCNETKIFIYKTQNSVFDMLFQRTYNGFLETPEIQHGDRARTPIF
jgi:hypothetical protein